MEGCVSFSIIIPTYRRPRQLATCLQALAHLDYPRDSFEVVVVNDDSELPPEEAIRPFRHQLDVKLLTQPQAGPAAARNTGAQNARGEFLAFTDDDCTPSPGWLGALARGLEQAAGCAVGGHTINALVDNPYSAASQMLIDYLYSYFNADHGEATFFTSNNLCVPAERFRAIGGFDASFPFSAEDREFCDRWLHSSNRLVYEPAAVVYHRHPLTLRKFLRQHFNYGRGAPHFHQVHLQRSHLRIRVEPATFYRNLLRYPFEQAPGRRELRATLLLAVSQMAYVCGALWERTVR